MKISLNWIKDYVKVGISSEKLADKLTMAGLEEEDIKSIDRDTVFELEITPNRPDCLSIIGIAREISAILNKELAFPKINKLISPKKKCDIKIEDKKGCRRYIGTLVKDVSIKEAPQWMRAKIGGLGLRVINNVVDVTNFCLMETGQPLHAFDFDKLIGGKIIVRRAKQGEKIVTIDNVEKELDSSILVIADQKRPVAIAGIMGGKDTEVTAATKNILLESAYFDPILIRRAARKLGLSSDSSYRFERGVDYFMVEKGQERALSLILECAKGKIVKKSDMEASKPKGQKNSIAVSIDSMAKFLGAEISLSECRRILENLGCKVSTEKKNILKVCPPSFREDIKEEVDIVEEIARIIGYDNLPSILPQVKVSGIKEDEYLKTRKTIRRILLAQGFNETVTYTMINQKFLDDSKQANLKGLKIVNPLTRDQEMMTPTMLPSMLNILRFNLNRGEKDLKLFEAGKIYNKDGERETLAIIATGVILRDWRKLKQDEAGFYDIKGAIEQVLVGAGIKDEDISFVLGEEECFEEGQRAAILLKGKKIGFLGKIDSEVFDAWDIKGATAVFAQMDIESLYAYSVKVKKYKPIIEYPVVVRDISLAIKKNVNFQEIKKEVLENKSDILTSIHFKEEYLGEKIPEDQRGIVFSLKYQSSRGTLREEDVTSVHESICQVLINKFQAVRR